MTTRLPADEPASRHPPGRQKAVVRRRRQARSPGSARKSMRWTSPSWTAKSLGWYVSMKKQFAALPED